MKQIVIIGGMAAGCKAAARLKRLLPEAKVIIVEKRPYVSYGACGMPLYASGEVDTFFDLASTSFGMVRDKDYFKDVKDIDVLTETTATKIDIKSKTVVCSDKDGEEFILNYDELIIATGARPVKPPFPCAAADNISTFHNPLDAKKFRIAAEQMKVGSAVIIGGGYIGCELAEAMVSLWGIETTLVELENSLLTNAIDKEISQVLEKTMQEAGVNLKLNSKVTSVELNEFGKAVVKTEMEEFTADYVFLCLGIEPVVDLAAEAGIQLGETGAIAVDKKLKTDLDNIWAAGDCIEIECLISGTKAIIPLGSLSNRQGRVIADNIAGLESEFDGSTKTISIKIFDLTTASAGLNEKEALALGLNYRVINANFEDRPHYHPDSRTIFAKMLYDYETMRLLGLQLAGKGEITRYIDVFSELLRNIALVYDLEDVEHAYNPPHSGPISPLNNLGYMASAQEEFGIINVNPLNAKEFQGQLLDVREQNEVEENPFNDGTENCSVISFRTILNKFDKEKPIMVLCQRGPRSFEVAKVLQNLGFIDVSYLGGGMTALNVILDKDEE